MPQRNLPNNPSVPSLILQLTTPLLIIILAWLSIELKWPAPHSYPAWPITWLPAGLALFLLDRFGASIFLSVLIGQCLSIPLIYIKISIPIGQNILEIAILCLSQTLQPFLIYLFCKALGLRHHFLKNSRQFFLTFLIMSLVIMLESLTLMVINHNRSNSSPSLLNTIFQFNVQDFGLSNILGILAITYPAQGLLQSKAIFKNHMVLEFSLWLIFVLITSFAIDLNSIKFIVLYIPLLTWAATRFSSEFMAYSLITIIVMLILSLGHAGLATNSILIETQSLFQWVLILSLFCTLYIHLIMGERERIEIQLEDKVSERTQQLQSINQELRDEVFIRQQAEKSFRASAKQYRALIETAGSPIVVMDKQFIIQKWNSAAETLFGYSRDEIVGKNYVDCFVPSKWQDETAWKIIKVLESGVSMQNLESETISFDGSVHIMLWNINRLADREGETSQVIIVGQDITEIKTSQDQLHYLAHFDVLTDTANRRMFEDRCEQALQSVKRHNHNLAIIHLDIDHFKRINDSLGHDAGDQLLIELTTRIKGCVREEDTVCRMGGDEFAVLLANISSPDGAQVVAKNILKTFTQPLKIGGSELIITCSIGVTLAPRDGIKYSDLLKNADMAMYRAKNAGRNNIQNYCPEMNEALQHQISLERGLRKALKENQFTLFYQPIVDLDSGKVIAMESLLRWKHPTKGLFFPGSFLEVAEQTGLLLTLCEWTLHNACLQGKAIMAMNNEPVQITVNLSSRQFSHPELLELLSSILQSTRFPAGNLIVEITEETLLDHMDLSTDVLNRLKALGVNILLDSFGTGMSSISKLLDLPIDIVKIDRTFVQGSTSNPNDAMLTETLITIAHQLEIKTIAAGVETEQQATFLRKNGCRMAQGHLYAKALPSDDLPSLFKALREGQSLFNSNQFYLNLGTSQT